ncbi:hypothetical protein [Halospeciosus flavus]|uniref:Nucleotide modification associated domain-containing protein n=1 Tax=Halospeciosus flavus TaxID=3032283 RepID=A0ABD5Z7X6_9EURY|nr:hypothetical protein [Halospeciosus flavus]
MPRAVAVNVGANTNQPGFRGPVFPDGSFAYVPIPESEPIRDPAAAPTYGDLAPRLPLAIPDDLRETPVHLDPSFADYPRCSSYTYGDPHGVKARPLADLDAGDYVFFYATLSCARREDGSDADASFAEWLTPEWGAYLIGHFRLASDPLVDPVREDVPEHLHENAHYRRESFDAAVLLDGDPDASRLYDRAVPLSGERGVDANHVVTEWSADLGKGPWWRRPLRFDRDATASLREWVDRDDFPAVR